MTSLTVVITYKTCTEHTPELCRTTSTSMQEHLCAVFAGAVYKTRHSLNAAAQSVTSCQLLQGVAPIYRSLPRQTAPPVGSSRERVYTPQLRNIRSRRLQSY